VAVADVCDASDVAIVVCDASEGVTAVRDAVVGALEGCPKNHHDQPARAAASPKGINRMNDLLSSFVMVPFVFAMTSSNTGDSSN